MIRRLYVEKKKEFGTEEKALCRELADNLDIKGLREGWKSRSWEDVRLRKTCHRRAK